LVGGGCEKFEIFFPLSAAVFISHRRRGGWKVYK
jgi:hypothetical protein